MRVIVQRVARAEVTVEKRRIASIGTGLLILAGFEEQDSPDDIARMAGKLARMRIFPDADGAMNSSVADIGGEILAVSQFTLFASTRKGNRPSWNRAAPGPVSRPLFDAFVQQLAAGSGCRVSTGEFGADMQVTLTNDGPVTLFLDSRHPE